MAHTEISADLNEDDRTLLKVNHRGFMRFALLKLIEVGAIGIALGFVAFLLIAIGAMTNASGFLFNFLMIIGIVAAVIALICVVLRLADIMKEAEEVAKIERQTLTDETDDDELTEEVESETEEEDESEESEEEDEDEDDEV
jgi:Sec-independent protein translocase protein TatA